MWWWRTLQPCLPDRRLEVTKLGKGFFNVFIRHGFFETPDVPRALESARPFGLAIDVSNTTFFIGRETLVPSDPPDSRQVAHLALHASFFYRPLAGPVLPSAAEQGGGDGHAGDDLRRIPIHRAGWPFIAVAWPPISPCLPLAGWLGWCLVPLTLWVIAFFRDPERVPPPGGNLVLSPADGRLLPPLEASPPPELGLGPGPLLKLSIFMSIFDVHVNRIPCDGTVTALAYRPGKFFNASFDKASLLQRAHVDPDRDRRDTEGWVRTLVSCRSRGSVARRIQCGLQEGQTVCRGDRFGIIRFGSRLEVFLPAGARVLVREGQKRSGRRDGARGIPVLMARMGRMGRSNLVRTAEALREDSRLGKFLPSALTLLGLCSGATAIWFALGRRLEGRRCGNHLRGRIRYARWPPRAPFRRCGRIRRAARFACRSRQLRHRAGRARLHVDALSRAGRGLGVRADLLRGKRDPARALQRRERRARSGLAAAVLLHGPAHAGCRLPDTFADGACLSVQGAARSAIPGSARR